MVGTTADLFVGLPIGSVRCDAEVVEMVPDSAGVSAYLEVELDGIYGPELMIRILGVTAGTTICDRIRFTGFVSVLLLDTETAGPADEFVGRFTFKIVFFSDCVIEFFARAGSAP